MEFLGALTKRPCTTALPVGFSAEGLFLSDNPENTLEIVLVSTRLKPKRQDLTKAWRDRRGGRATPVLMIVVYGEVTSICGPSGDNPAITENIDVGRADRLACAALDLPDRLSAQRFLHGALPTLETALPGITNEGMLALHNLTTTARTRADWGQASQQADTAAKQSGEALLSALGYSVKKLDNLTKVLRSSDKRTALAVLLGENESIEGGSSRFNTLSPISYAMSKADEENLTWIIIVRGNRIRLYSAEVGKGVGRRGRTETFIECQPALLASNDLAYLWLLFSADALAKEGSLEELLASSERFAGDLAERLRDRIYAKAAPNLARGIVKARGLTNPSREELDLTYQMALVVLFRLLFIAYAEDRDLLPYRQNEAYRRRSLTEKAKELAKAVADKTPIGSGHHHWQECGLLFSAINTGNTEWSVPQYGGGLFALDSEISPAGAALEGLEISNKYFEAALRALLVTDAEGTPGVVDFRSLGVREFGTIYEGLLEAALSAAETDLMLNKKATYVPVVEGKEADVKVGEIYLHNKSGARKSSGSYYTKSFAVEYLLDGALEPALDDHFKRLDEMSSDADAAEAFFNFRVADIAMGSGHFLVAAVDRIEARMANYLKKRQGEGHPLTSVQQDLSYLRTAAQTELGGLKGDFDIEDGQLLRRQIARRCIYGVDLNPLAVQLARLSIWIHTFAPGLPLSLLDHNLVHGNALIGVGTVEEIRKKFDQESGGLFQVDADNLLGQAAKPLQRLANLKDATPADIEAGRQAMQEARRATLETEALCDLITAHPISEDKGVKAFQFERWEKKKDTIHASRELIQARKDLEGLHAFHFPVQFPEVFLGCNPGFNVILGNPPWEEVKAEERDFWTRASPGLRSKSQREQKAARAELRESRPDLLAAWEEEESQTHRMAQILRSGPYPGMETGDPDLYQAFCWRFWTLTSNYTAGIGVVLPRSALATKGTEKFRRNIFMSASQINITTTLNSGGWMFDDAEHRYTISMVTILKAKYSSSVIQLKGPYSSLAQFEAARTSDFARFDAEEVLTWSESASLPLLPTPESIEVFRQLRKSPWLGDASQNDWRMRADAELHATNQAPMMDLTSPECPKDFWPIFKGQSFNIWDNDTGEYYGWGNPDTLRPWLFDKRKNSATRRQDSAHAEFSEEHWQNIGTLACNAPRIAFRNIARGTDTRTLITALIPPNAFLTNAAPYFLWPRGDKKNEAYALGVLNSIPLDWYARCFVEVNMNFFILNAFPVPRPSRNDPLWQRVVQLAGRLACPDKRFKDWAAEVNVDWGPLGEAEKNSMIYELDAVAAHLYGLSADQLTHIFETFHKGWDYQPRLAEVMRHYEKWSNTK